LISFTTSIFFLVFRFELIEDFFFFFILAAKDVPFRVD
jgi:hypothetical protein